MNLQRKDGTPLQLNDGFIEQWYALLPEKDARSIVATVPGSMEYGLVRSWRKLPAEAKQLVREAYSEAHR
jgi:hypothetical protein